MTGIDRVGTDCAKDTAKPIIALIKQTILDLNQSGGINQVSRFFEMKTSQNNSVSKNN